MLAGCFTSENHSKDWLVWCVVACVGIAHYHAEHAHHFLPFSWYHYHYAWDQLQNKHKNTNINYQWELTMIHFIIQNCVFRFLLKKKYIYVYNIVCVDKKERRQTLNCSNIKFDVLACGLLQLHTGENQKAKNRQGLWHHNSVYILSSKHTNQPMRAHILSQLFYNKIFDALHRDEKF